MSTRRKDRHTSRKGFGGPFQTARRHGRLVLNAQSPKAASIPHLSSTLSLRLFGPWSAWAGGRPLPALRTRKEAWLLALLALRTHAPLERSWLAGALWPDARGDAALYNLRRSLHGLRAALGPEADRLLSPTPRTLRLDLDGAECDVSAFDAAVRRGDSDSLAEAAALYTGPLLLGCLEDWALPERESRERAALDVLERLAADARARGDLAGAAGHLSQALEIDPLRENALRGFMETLTAQGRRAAATEAYRAFRLRLRDELNAEPAPQTVTLYRGLRAQSRQEARHLQPDPTPGDQAPAVRALPPDTMPLSRLPASSATLIGRAGETQAVAAHLDGARLVTLTGTGGVGKTRLSLAVAHHLHDEFPDGTWFADLAPLADPLLIADAVLGALGARPAPGRAPADALTDLLRHKRLLLLMDNCEHLVSACAALARALLERCPALHILATSREILGVPGEVAWRVPSLSLPDGTGGDPRESDAVRLFVARARAARPDWEPSAQDDARVAEICRRLDGIPLAIEMAAARVRALPVEGIASRLGDAFRLLSSPAGSRVPRHQTLRAALDWSWDLLPLDERALLARLSVFAGGWTLDAAEEVCADVPEAPGEGNVLDGLTGLVDKSLVLFEERSGAGRYRLLETVRQYGGERLAERGESGLLCARHAAWFLALAEQAEPRLTGPEQGEWLDRLEADHENLRSALVWCRAQADITPDAETRLLRLGGALARFWWIRGHQQEGRYFLEPMLERLRPDVPGRVRLKALLAAAALVESQGAYDDARRRYEQALALARRLDDRAGEAAALGGLAEAVGNQGDHPAARILLQNALILNRNAGDLHRVATNLGYLGYLARLLGDAPAARAFLDEAVAISRRTGDPLGVASHQGSLASLLGDQGDHDGARVLLEETLALYRSLGNRGGIAWTLSSLAHLAARRDDLPAARALLEEALAINHLLANRAGEAWNLRSQGEVLARQGRQAQAELALQRALAVSEEIGDRTGAAWCRHGLGAAAQARGDIGAALGFERSALQEMLHLDLKTGAREVAESLAALLSLAGRPADAARLLGALDAERERLGLTPSPVADRGPADAALGELRDRLGTTAFTDAWAAGRATPLAHAITQALADES